MSEMPLSADPQAYLENLMRAGQDAMKRFDDALASATGVQTEEYLSSGRPPFPFALIADLQREYLKQIWRALERDVPSDIFQAEHMWALP